MELLMHVLVILPLAFASAIGILCLGGLLLTAFFGTIGVAVGACIGCLEIIANVIFKDVTMTNDQFHLTESRCTCMLGGNSCYECAEKILRDGY